MMCLHCLFRAPRYPVSKINIIFRFIKYPKKIGPTVIGDLRLDTQKKVLLKSCTVYFNALCIKVRYNVSAKEVQIYLDNIRVRARFHNIKPVGKLNVSLVALCDKYGVLFEIMLSTKAKTKIENKRNR